jgi:hypothetical protein
VRVPTTTAEVEALEASYVPFGSASTWDRSFPAERLWQQDADQLGAAVATADVQVWEALRDDVVRACALDSAALAGLVHPSPVLTQVILRESLDAEDWSALADQTALVVECHRRAFVIAGDIAAAGVHVDEHVLARLQDLIVESQRTYTVTIDDGSKAEVDLPRRQYKPVSNYAIRANGELVPFAPAGRVSEEMERLVGELASPAFAEFHPVVQAAFIHVALTRIHPFADGNGRLARTACSIPLMRATGVPLLLLGAQWPRYADVLAAADAGETGPMVALVAAAHINAMDLARNALRRRQTRVAQVVRSRLVDDYLVPSPGRLLLDTCLATLRDVVGPSTADRRLVVTRSTTNDDVRARVVIAGPVGTARRDWTISVAEVEDVEGWLQLTVHPEGDRLTVAVADVEPYPSDVIALRLSAWLDRLLAQPSARVVTGLPRVLFVLGSPRSGTTMMGNYLGSHPDVLGLAEYGGFYISHSIAPAYLARLPGLEHDGFLDRLRQQAAEHAETAAAELGCRWYCDATPWNLEIAGQLALDMPDAIFMLMVRHFAGAVLSLRNFAWAGSTVEDAARLWASISANVAQLPADRTIIVSYDVLAAEPQETVAGLCEAVALLGLDPDGLDDTELATSHAALVGQPRPTIARVVDGAVSLAPIPSLNEGLWTPELQARVWPIVADTHRALREMLPSTYVSPPRPPHVSPSEW